MATVKITTVGNSLGIVLPREMLERLRVDKGDLLYLVETPTGIELTAYEPLFAAQMEALENTARSERDLLRHLHLAKPPGVGGSNRNLGQLGELQNMGDGPASPAALRSGDG
jgi:putative addiction module antidote